MDRRDFLRRAGLVGAASALGTGFWRSALAAPAKPGGSPYGPLLAPDPNGLMLPEGFTSRVVTASLATVPGTSYSWHVFPDGGACVPTDDGGWIYVSNSEFPIPADVPIVVGVLAGSQRAIGALDLPIPRTGGVGAIRFGPDGSVQDAYPVLSGSVSNCAGGLTPWGTWLSCEEWEDADGLTGFGAGVVWECDPHGVAPAAARPSLGLFKHEMAAVDAGREQIYLSEDQDDGLVYRYTASPGTWGSGAALEGGVLHAMAVDAAGSVQWIRVADFADPAAPATPLRTAVAGATPFNGGEGLIYDDGHVYLTTKGDGRVWSLDVAAQEMSVLYDVADHVQPVLRNVDNLAISAAHDLYVAQDGGADIGVCVITPERVVAPVVRLTGGQHGTYLDLPLPLVSDAAQLARSEVTGLAFSPDGDRLYLNSQRGMGIGGLPIGPGLGILYEVSGPFRGSAAA